MVKNIMGPVFGNIPQTHQFWEKVISLKVFSTQHSTYNHITIKD